MHTICALTLMQARYSSGGRSQNAPIDEAYHHYESVLTFSKRVRQPTAPNPTESAAVWVTAILSSTISFARIESNHPEEAWPLKSPSQSDLSWLLLGQGKVQIFEMIQPLKKEPQYRGLLPPQAAHIRANDTSIRDLQAIPNGLLQLCNIDDIDNSNNPYFDVAVAYAKSLNQDATSALLIFFCLVRNVSSDFKSLLLQKNPPALLLLALWYAKLSEMKIWWLQPRVKLEGHAICMFLRRQHRHDHDLQCIMREVLKIMPLHALCQH